MFTVRDTVALGNFRSLLKDSILLKHDDRDVLRNGCEDDCRCGGSSLWNILRNRGRTFDSASILQRGPRLWRTTCQLFQRSEMFYAAEEHYEDQTDAEDIRLRESRKHANALTTSV